MLRVDVGNTSRGRFSYIKDQLYWFPLTVGDFCNIFRWGGVTVKEIGSLTVHYLSIGYLSQQAAFSKVAKAALKTTGYALLILCKPAELALCVVISPRFMRWSHSHLYEPELQRQAKEFERKIIEFDGQPYNETERPKQINDLMNSLKPYPLAILKDCRYQEAKSGYAIYDRLTKEKKALKIASALLDQLASHQPCLEDPEKQKWQMLTAAVDFIDQKRDQLTLLRHDINEQQYKKLWTFRYLLEWEEIAKKVPRSPQKDANAPLLIESAKEKLGGISQQLNQAEMWSKELELEDVLARLLHIRSIVQG